MRDDGLVDGHGRGVHLLGLDELHISSADGATFFVLVVAQERSAQLRASVTREFFFQRRNGVLRGDKIFEVKMINDGQPARF